MNTIFIVSFWACVSLIVIGASLGLLGLWAGKLIHPDVRYKLIITDFILIATTFAVAAAIKILSR